MSLHLEEEGLGEGEKLTQTLYFYNLKYGLTSKASTIDRARSKSGILKRQLSAFLQVIPSLQGWALKFWFFLYRLRWRN